MKANLAKMLEMARAHMDNGGLRAAEVYWRMILKATENPVTNNERIACADACGFFARRAVYNRRHGEAADWYQRAVFADALAIDYRLEFIVKVLLPMSMFRSALINAEHATRLDPKNPDCWRALAISASALGEVDKAAGAYDRQVALDPDNPLARIDRAVLAINTGDYLTGRRMVEPILEKTAAGGGTNGRAASEAVHALAMMAYRESRHEEAIDLFDRALAGDPQDPAQVRWNKSLALHAIGRYREGFVESENRGRQKADEPMRLVMNRFQAPMMSPEDLDGPPLRIHVHQEMGNGDAIAMARYLPLLVAKGHDVRLETLESTEALFRRSFPGINVMPRALDYPAALGIPMFDKHATTLSLPWLFGTEVDSVPWFGPYLKADHALADEFDGEIGAGSRPKIGICWSSGIRNDGLWISEYGRRKSMHFHHMIPIIAACRRSTDIVSLQVGPERDQAKVPTVSFADRVIDNRVIDVLPAKPTWDETAALISRLDLVITVDTAVAHLAGALGIPAWVMMQRDGSTWHFMCWRPGAVWNERSPWYPSIRIFRQHEFNRPHFWDEVVDDVARELVSWQESRSIGQAAARRLAGARLA